MTDSKSSNLTARATYALRQKIIDGALPGGTRLYEVALSEELDISRTPMREAMSRLAEEGLLDRAPGGGFMVRAFTLRDVIDAIELRGVLEGTAARLAAEHGADAQGLDELRQLLCRIDALFQSDSAADLDAYSTLNAAFHDRMSALCRSPVILRELERVKSLPFASPSAFVLDTPDRVGGHQSLLVAQVQHRAMVDAVAAREGARAEAIAREHARIARANLETALRARGPAPDQVPGLSLIVP